MHVEKKVFVFLYDSLENANTVNKEYDRKGEFNPIGLLLIDKRRECKFQILLYNLYVQLENNL